MISALARASLATPAVSVFRSLLGSGSLRPDDYSFTALPPLCYIPCLPKSKDAGSDAVFAALCPAGVAAAAEDKPPPVQKIEVAVAGKDDEDKKDEADEETAVAAAPAVPQKSNLKKANCADSKYAARGNVKWLDLLGKDLTEVKEFEPSESGDSLDDGDGILACVCVIQ